MQQQKYSSNDHYHQAIKLIVLKVKQSGHLQIKNQRNEKVRQLSANCHPNKVTSIIEDNIFPEIGVNCGIVALENGNNIGYAERNKERKTYVKDEVPQL